MATRRYLIVGGGMTGHADAIAIRQADPEGAIAILSAEPERPYARPPLTKGCGWASRRRASGCGTFPASTSTSDAERRRSTCARAWCTTMRASNTATIACSSRRAARPDGSRSAASGSSTTARTPTTAACAPSRGAMSS
jgi:hypothetical protein